MKSCSVCASQKYHHSWPKLDQKKKDKFETNQIESLKLIDGSDLLAAFIPQILRPNLFQVSNHAEEEEEQLLA